MMHVRSYFWKDRWVENYYSLCFNGFTDVHKLGKLKMKHDKKLIDYYTLSIEKNYKPWHTTDVATANPHA